MLIRIIFLFLQIIISCSVANTPNIRTKPLNGTVALTFDDGPNPTTTIKILKILKQHNIKATFFVMGTLAKKHPNIILQIIKEGHAVASHTMTHPKLTRISKKRLYFEIVQSKKLISLATGGIAPVCVRPPYGMGNKKIAKFIQSHNMVMVSMGFNSFDYKNKGSRWLANWVIKNARNQQVFLFHDGYKQRPQTVAALPQIIKGIKRKQLGFSAICHNPKFKHIKI